MLKSLLFAAVFAFASFAVQAQAPLKSKPVIKAELDHADALYKCGEEAKFKVTVTQDGKILRAGTLNLVFNQDGAATVLERKIELAKENPATIAVKLHKPGFVMLAASYQDGDFRHDFNTVAAAGADVGKITAGAPPPADLLEYWHAQYKKLKDEVPPNFTVEKVGETPHCIRYSVTADNFGGTKIYAGLTIPKKKGSYPMIVTVPPAGNWGVPYWEYPNAIRLTITVFDRLFDKQENTYEKFNNPVWYFYKGTEKRETYYYYKSILGALRMLDYAATIPEWDQKNMIAVGRSQGGAFSFIMTALNPKITAMAADVPALCDHNANLQNRKAGWPQLLQKSPGFAEGSKYFDTANFAAYVKCPAIVSVGFIDTMCTPASVYSAFNNLKGEKNIYNGPLTGHGWGEKNIEFQLLPLNDFIKSQIK